jgi:hypothetical protein
MVRIYEANSITVDLNRQLGEIVESIFGVLYLAARKPWRLRSNLRGTI